MADLSDFKRPYNVVMTVIAIIGIAASVYFYYSSQRSIKPTYRTYEQSEIFDASNPTPKLSLLSEDGTKIEDSVFVAEVSIWNAGTLGIEPTDVRLPITVQLAPESVLRDYSIVEEFDQRVTGFKVTQTANDLRPGIKIAWDHFDPGHGLRVQLIYSLPIEVPIAVDGLMLSTSMQSAAPLEGASTLLKRAFVVILIVVFLAIIASDTWLGELAVRLTGWNGARFLGYPLVFLLCLALIGVVVKFVNGAVPPV